MESNLAGILDILDSNAVADRQLGEATVSVQQRVSEISQTIAGVQVIGVEMQRIALNAAIQAARLGQDGDALEIVANAVQGLAREAGTASGTIEDLLSNTRAAVMSLGQASAASEGSVAQRAQLRRSAEGLKSAQEEAQGGYAQTLEMIAGVKQQIGEAIALFGTQREGLDLLEGAIEKLRGLTLELPAGWSEAARIPSTYTMQSERVVHESRMPCLWRKSSRRLCSQRRRRRRTMSNSSERQAAGGAG